MRVLDLFCGAGGAGEGYRRAGAEVLGIDIAPQPDYPGEFIRGDVLAVWREVAESWRPDLVHLSPPCQALSALTAGNRARGRKDDHKDMVPAARRIADAIGAPAVVENVPGAMMRRDIVLCGEMFGLGVVRHRYFEARNGLWTPLKPHQRHRGVVAGRSHGRRQEGPYVQAYGRGGGKPGVAGLQAALDAGHITSQRALVEAIPPAYTEWIARNARRGPEGPLLLT